MSLITLMFTDAAKDIFFVDTILGLERYIKLTKDERDVMEKAIGTFPMRITTYYLSLIDPNDPADPIRKMCIPSAQELDASGELDTSGEGANTVLNGIQHKYAQTALVLSSSVCATYCRHCFRKRMVGASETELCKKVNKVVGYVRAHPEITNVLLSGGDAFMNPNCIIRQYLDELCEIKTLDLIRFGSRVPVVLPRRIYDDPELLHVLLRASYKKSIYVITQFNHPRELTTEAELAIGRLQDSGVRVRNQTVLLRGVNDDGEVLGALLRRLTVVGIEPYYIFQCRPVKGIKNLFQVPLVEGVSIIDQAKNMQNGIGKSFRYAMSHPRGKIEILGMMDHENMLFKFHQAKNPVDASRIFQTRVHPETTWLNADLQQEIG